MLFILLLAPLLFSLFGSSFSLRSSPVSYTHLDVYKRQGKKLTNAEFAHEWACAVARHPEFLRYQSILIPIIETNTSLDRLVEFKKNFALMNESIRTLLRKHLSCSANEASDLSLCLIYQAAALFNHFNCAEQVAEAMRLAGLPPIEGNFEDAYTSFVEMCLDRLSQ